MTPTQRPLTPPIVVIGSARSGTSLTAGLIASQGVWTGPTRPATDKNPRGFFENDALSDAVRGNEPADPSRVAAIMYQQGYRGGPWVVKHGLGGHAGWLSLSPRFVCVRRDVESVVASQMRWQNKNKSREKRLAMVSRQQAELDRIRDELGGVDFWPADVVRRDLSAFVRLCHDVEIGEPDQAAARAFVEPLLWDRET